jgi:transposase
MMRTHKKPLKKGFRQAVKKARRIAAARGRPLRVMFADEARFGRMHRPRPCWAPAGVRPKVACQLVREFIYLHGAISPKDGASAFLIVPSSDAQCFQIFLDALAKKCSRWHILLILDGAGNHKSGELAIPADVTLARLPAHSPELNPQENIWDEIREKIFKNYAAKSMDEVCEMLVEGSLYIERNPEPVKSMTFFPCIASSIWSGVAINHRSDRPSRHPVTRKRTSASPKWIRSHSSGRTPPKRGIISDDEHYHC